MLFDALKTASKKTLYTLGYYHLYARLKAPLDNRLLVIMYHDFVEDSSRQDNWSIWGRTDRSEFAAHLAALKDHFRVITLEDAFDEINRTGRLQEKSVAVTIDDGYLSNYTIAFPELRRAGVSATIYLPTDWIDRTMTPWWITLSSLVQHCDCRQLPAEAIEKALGISLRAALARPRDETLTREILLHEMESHFRDCDPESIQQMLRQLRPLLPQDPTIRPEYAPITWDQAREMAKHGIRFGAHTVSHPNLALVDMATAEAEIRDSKKRIEEQTSMPVTGFAYPYGLNYHEYVRLRPLLQKYGLQYACTATSGVNDVHTDRYRLVRTTLPLVKSPALIKRLLILDYLAQPVAYA